jgi:RNA polymerase sigma factor (sigma-70 family)
MPKNHYNMARLAACRGRRARPARGLSVNAALPIPLLERADMSDELQQRDFQTLLRAAQAGDEEASRELYETYVKYVLICVRHRMWHRLRSKFDSQDFVQQVWASFFDDRNDLPDFQTPEDLIAYLQTMAERKVIMEGRRRRQPKNDMRLENPVHEDSDMVGMHPATRLPTPSAVAVFREQYDRLVEQQVPEVREVAELRVEGNSFSEISQKLEINESTARKAIRRIRKRASANEQGDE